MIRTTLRQKTLQSTQLKFYKVMAVPVLTYASEILDNKLIRKKENKSALK
jgi:hypothetical protein